MHQNAVPFIISFFVRDFPVILPDSNRHFLGFHGAVHAKGDRIRPAVLSDIQNLRLVLCQHHGIAGRHFLPGIREQVLVFREKQGDLERTVRIGSDLHRGEPESHALGFHGPGKRTLAFSAYILQDILFFKELCLRIGCPELFRQQGLQRRHVFKHSIQFYFSTCRGIQVDGFPDLVSMVAAAVRGPLFQDAQDSCVRPADVVIHIILIAQERIRGFLKCLPGLLPDSGDGFCRAAFRRAELLERLGKGRIDPGCFFIRTDIFIYGGDQHDIGLVIYLRKIGGPEFQPEGAGYRIAFSLGDRVPEDLGDHRCVRGIQVIIAEPVQLQITGDQTAGVAADQAVVLFFRNGIALIILIRDLGRITGFVIGSRHGAEQPGTDGPVLQRQRIQAVRLPSLTGPGVIRKQIMIQIIFFIMEDADRVNDNIGQRAVRRDSAFRQPGSRFIDFINMKIGIQRIRIHGSPGNLQTAVAVQVTDHIAVDRAAAVLHRPFVFFGRDQLQLSVVIRDRRSRRQR